MCLRQKHNITRYATVHNSQSLFYSSSNIKVFLEPQANGEKKLVWLVLANLFLLFIEANGSRDMYIIMCIKIIEERKKHDHIHSFMNPIRLSLKYFNVMKSVIGICPRTWINIVGSCVWVEGGIATWLVEDLTAWMLVNQTNTLNFVRQTCVLLECSSRDRRWNWTVIHTRGSRKDKNYISPPAG